MSNILTASSHARKKPPPPLPLLPRACSKNKLSLVKLMQPLQYVIGVSEYC